MRTIETSFGELYTEDGGLSASIDSFFTSMQDLSAHPGEDIYQNQLVTDAASLASQFRSMGEFFNGLESRIELEAESLIEEINALVAHIAELNGKIEALEMKGTNANSMKDQRDHGISELSDLLGVQILNRSDGIVDVSVGGIPLVMSAFAYELELNYNDSNEMGISIKNADNYATVVEGGRIGGMLALKNTTISDIRSDLDTLAYSVIQQVNQYHVQGVGSAGSFTDLAGWSNSTANLADVAGVTDGNFYIRLTNTSTGAIARHEITVDAVNGTIGDVATAISAITGLTASANSANQLSILADANYEFDFIPAVLSAPTAQTLTGAAPPTMTASGVYTGSANDTLTFTIGATGDVSNGTLQLNVTDSSGAVATVSIGAGYAAGDEIEIGDTGISITLTLGDLVIGDTYEVDVFANTDTAGLLSGLGINTFFTGNSAINMNIAQDITSDPRRIATSLQADLADNTNTMRIASIRNNAVSDLDNLDVGTFYQKMTANIGQDLSLKQMKLDNLDVMVLNLANQQAEVSGVDINDQAAQMLVFEQMFQGMAKYMNTINDTLDALMGIL
jgi:flagellar hook-associated protein 1 FlgK